MAIKGQHFKNYPESVKREAIRLHVEEGWSYPRITEHLAIHDHDRVKKWTRAYRRKGEIAFKDCRGNPHRVETEHERNVRRMEMEIEVLKKWLAILSKEVRKQNTGW